MAFFVIPCFADNSLINYIDGLSGTRAHAECVLATEALSRLVMFCAKRPFLFLNDHYRKEDKMFCYDSYGPVRTFIPWWGKRLKDISELTVRPSRTFGDNTNERAVIWPCSEEIATFWAVYGRYTPVGYPESAEVLCTCTAEIDAQNFHDALIRRNPHLRNKQPKRWMFM